MKKGLILASLLGASLFARDMLEINANKSDFNFIATADLAKMTKLPQNQYYLHLSYLKAEGEFKKSKFKEDDNIYSIGFSLFNLISQTTNTWLSIGVKEVIVDENVRWKQDKSFYSTALGLGINYYFPVKYINPILFNVTGYYGVLNSKDAEKYSEIDVRIADEIIKNGEIFIGYRAINMEFDKISESKEFYNPYAGFKFYF